MILSRNTRVLHTQEEVKELPPKNLGIVLRKKKVPGSSQGMRCYESVGRDMGFWSGKLVPGGLLPARGKHLSERTAALRERANLDSVLSLTQKCRSVPLFCRHDNFLKITSSTRVLAFLSSTSWGMM